MAKTLAPLDSNAQFFYTVAGFSYKTGTDPEKGKRENARALARAEAWARKHGIQFDWSDDSERSYCYCDDSDCPYHEGGTLDRGDGWETLYCVAYEDCYCNNAAHKPHRNILASLSGIMAPSREYRRVIEAELTLEARAEKGGR